MSYSIYLKCTHCNSVERVTDPTYNLTPIFDFALTGEELPNADVSEAAVVLFHKETDRPRGLRLLNGKKASDSVPMISAAIHRLEDPANEETLKRLEPSNGWGTVKGAIEVMRELRQTAIERPMRFWEIH